MKKSMNRLRRNKGKRTEYFWHQRKYYSWDIFWYLRWRKRRRRRRSNSRDFGCLWFCLLWVIFLWFLLLRSRFSSRYFSLNLWCFFRWIFWCSCCSCLPPSPVFLLETWGVPRVDSFFRYTNQTCHMIWQDGKDDEVVSTGGMKRDKRGGKGMKRVKEVEAGFWWREMRKEIRRRNEEDETTWVRDWVLDEIFGGVSFLCLVQQNRLLLSLSLSFSWVLLMRQVWFPVSPSPSFSSSYT